jgi:hypothetical protein
VGRSGPAGAKNHLLRIRANEFGQEFDHDAAGLLKFSVQAQFP